MYASHLGTDRMPTEVESPTLDDSTTKQAIEALDAVATRSDDGKTIFVKLSNADPKRALQTTIVLRGKRINAEVEEVQLSAPAQGRMNDFAHPDVIRPKTVKVHCEAMCSFHMPPDSLAVLTFKLQ
jgi:alpha-L-arabinofuranosidase